jgi:streptogramin lyase
MSYTRNDLAGFMLGRLEVPVVMVARRWVSAILAVAAFPIAAAVASAAGPDILQPGDGSRLLNLPTPAYGNTVATAKDGSLWAASGTSLSRVDMAGNVQIYPVPHGTYADSIVAAPDGAVWYYHWWLAYGGGGSHIVRFDGRGFSVFLVPFRRQVSGLTVGPDGNMWYTTTGVHAHAGYVTLSAPHIHDMKLPFSSAWQIATGPDGNLWVEETTFGGCGPCVARMDTTGGNITIYPVASSIGPFLVANGRMYLACGSVTITICSIDPSSGHIVAYRQAPRFKNVNVAAFASPNGRTVDFVAWTPGDPNAAFGHIAASGRMQVDSLEKSVYPRSVAIGGDGNMWFANAYNPQLIQVYALHVLTASPSSLTFASEGQTLDVRIRETRYHKRLQFNDDCAMVAKVATEPDTHRLAVTSIGKGSCTITVGDNDFSNSTAIPVTSP